MQEIEQEIALRALAQRDLYTFVKLKWERYNKAHFMDNWHIEYLCKILESTLPRSQTLSQYSQELHKNASVITPEVCERRIHDLHRKDNADYKPITRLMINMPPSYGKSEIIARCFIAWALGRDRKRKFFYISYSDDLCRKIANQVRDLIKSPLWTHIFDYPPEFLQDNAQEFVLREGGGLFVTTLKSALTGFHADQILIDDPIKVSEMQSKSAINAVHTNFKESVLSRLQNNQSNITILMQRLSQNDLCGFLLNPLEFEDKIIQKWHIVRLCALENEPKTYQIGNFCYKRAANEPLFPPRHTQEELEALRLQMGNDEFSAQYLQEPLSTSGGYFDPQYYTHIFLHELSEYHTYIFVDNALSLKESADNRAIIVLGVENHKNSVRYVLLDCFYGIWSEEQTIGHILEAKAQYPQAKTYIESEGGGLVLHRLLLIELAKYNQKQKEQGKGGLNDEIFTYTPSRKVSKVDKIKAIRPFYNTGFLVFSHNARGQEQLKKELFSFNPDRPFKKDDCIDALGSAIIHEATKPPYIAPKQDYRLPRTMRYVSRPTWRI